MLTIIILFVVVTILLIVLSCTQMKTHDVVLILIGVIFVGVIIATSPIYGYHEKELTEEVELVEVYEDFYVTHYANDVYLYKYKVDNPSKGEESFETIIVKEKVIETEVENCPRPVLRKYIKKAKTGLFSFCWQKETEYEFYVPKGTIEYTTIVMN